MTTATAKRDYYEVLGVARSADAGAIKHAFRKLAMQPDSQLRLRGKGLPRFGARGRGDLYVRLAVKLPERLSAEERSLWERLRSLATR